MPDSNYNPNEWPTLRTVTLDVCDDCLDGKGGECHTPGCVLWLNRAPDIPFRDHPSVTINPRENADA